MEPLIQLTVLAAATVLAAGSAIALNWILLRSAFHLMQPAAARQIRPIQPDLVHGTRGAARHFVGS